MSTPTPEHEATQVLARRKLLKVGAVALGAVAVTAGPAGIASAGGQSDRARRRNTQRVTRQLLDAIASGDLARMWSFFDCGGVVSQPFTNTRVTDFATFQSKFAPFFSVAEGLHFTDPQFVDLLDPDATIAKYNGHALITSTGRSYDQTYITELHVRGDKVMFYEEYFDTYVLYVSLGYIDPIPA